MFSNHLQRSSDIPFLPPPEAKVADFNFILKQCPAARFSSHDGQQGLLIFEQENTIPGACSTAPFTIQLLHTIFLARGTDAAQLEIIDTSQVAGTYFRAAARLGPSQRLHIERDFDTVVLSDPTKRLPERSYSLVAHGSDHLTETKLHPIPPYPRLLLHHDTLGYLCFTFDRIGAYPKATLEAFGMVGIRGFQGQPHTWREFEVGSTRLTARGLNNLSIDTELGHFFIPGGGSCGDPTLSLKNGPTLFLQDFDLDDLLDPHGPRFNVGAHVALRSLGLPAEWPPAEMLAY